jgi:hypothetical protein
MAKKYEADIRFNWPTGYNEMCKILPREYPYVGTVLNRIKLMNDAADALDMKDTDNGK